MQFKPYHTLLFLLTAWIFLTNSRDPNNPPVARTGAPGETTCGASGCHSGGTFTGTVAISGVPDTVVANQTYTITLANTSNASKAGFQLTCLDSLNAYTGTLTNGTGTSIGTNNSTGRKYIRQSSPKTLSGGSTSWTFTWKAPASPAGKKCTFYFVSLCANGNGNKTGDNVLMANKVVHLKQTSAAPEAYGDTGSWLDFQANSYEKTLTVNLLQSNKGQIEVYDLQGKAALHQTLVANNNLSVGALPAGIYVARITAGGRTTSVKFFIN